MSTYLTSVILVQSDFYQESLLASAFLAMCADVRRITRALPVLQQLKALRQELHGPILVCADIVRLAQERLLWSHFASAVRTIIGEVELLATHSALLQPCALLRGWAKKHGALELCGRLSHLRSFPSMQPLIDSVRLLVKAPFDMRLFQTDIQRPQGALATESDSFQSYQQTWRYLHDMGQSPFSIAADLAAASEVPVKDRSYRLKSYPSCFLGSDAHRWLMIHFGMSATHALQVGLLMQKLGLIYHVTKDQPFRDGHFFYRSSAIPLGARYLDLDQVMQDSQSARGFEAQDRYWRGMRFRRCFIGAQAANWLQQQYRLSAAEAVGVGQALQDINHFRHVVDDRDFVDHEYYYRLTFEC